ncbi:MAG: glycosyltransferase [Actinobacteria bacterium]|nr:glycosyltransferase [Actinomycetota bacterium]MCG2801756.1 glycosyltransferase [Cellulomonas sp.]
MHIVHLTNAYAPASGGVRTVVHALGAGYRERGHRFTLVVPAERAGVDDEPWGTRLRLRGPRVPGTDGYRLLVDRRAVLRALDELAPDRVEVSDRFTLRAVGGWARAHGVPTVMLAHERLDGLVESLAKVPGPVARAVADRHNRHWAAAFDAVVVTSPFAAQEFDRIAVATERVPLGVDLELFTPSRRTRALDPDDLLLVLCSRLSPEKEPAVAVETLRLLRAEGVPARLVVVGDGPEAASLARRARGLPVTFTGFVPDRAAVADLLADADAVLAPGPLETFGLAALEAMACGTPVVAARGSAVEALTARVGGPPPADDPAGFAASVRTLVDGPAGGARSAARAVAEELGWAATVDRMLALHGVCPPAGVWSTDGVRPADGGPPPDGVPINRGVPIGEVVPATHGLQARDGRPTRAGART